MKTGGPPTNLSKKSLTAPSGNLPTTGILRNGTTTANIQYVLAPQTVTYENPNYDDNGAINSIISIIPLLVVVGIVLGAITWVTMIKGKE